MIREEVVSSGFLSVSSKKSSIEALHSDVNDPRIELHWWCPVRIDIHPGIVISVVKFLGDKKALQTHGAFHVSEGTLVSGVKLGGGSGIGRCRDEFKSKPK